MMTLAAYSVPYSFIDAGVKGWSGIAYVSIFSMLVGFFWYKGLAIVSIANVGHLQLFLPFLVSACSITFERANREDHAARDGQHKLAF